MRTKRTDPHDRLCAVKDCPNVEHRAGFCRSHYTELRDVHGYMAAAVAQMQWAHEQAKRRERAMRRKAKAAGIALRTPREHDATRAA